MDENIKKWPQTETGSQTGSFTLAQTILVFFIRTCNSPGGNYPPPNDPVYVSNPLHNIMQLSIRQTSARKA